MAAAAPGELGFPSRCRASVVLVGIVIAQAVDWSSLSVKFDQKLFYIIVMPCSAELRPSHWAAAAAGSALLWSFEASFTFARQTLYRRFSRLLNRVSQLPRAA